MDQLRRENENQQRLDSWKEIASFFSRDERTVKRWEKERGLPVRRVPGKGKSVVFAYVDELKDWLAGAVDGEGSETSETIPEERSVGVLAASAASHVEIEIGSDSGNESAEVPEALWRRRGFALLVLA